MKGPPGALSRDVLAGVVPWCPYWAGSALGYPGWGAVLAALALIALRFSAWRECKIFDLAILTFFIAVAGARCCLPLDAWDSYRPILLPTLLALVAFGSSALKRPCTIQYAREMVGPEWWHNRHFVRVNHIVTLVWGASFAAVAGLAFFAPAAGIHQGVVSGIAGVALFSLALWFTRAFPRWYRLHRYIPLVRAGREPFLRSPRFRPPALRL